MPAVKTLADWMRLYPVWWLHCDGCERSVQLDPAAIVERHGAGHDMMRFRRRVSCRECGARFPVVKIHCLADGKPAD